MLVTVFQNRPHVCFPPVLVVLHLLGGKQNLKHNLIHAVKVSLRHFMPFVRGARCFSHWFFIAFSSSFCWSVSKEGGVSVKKAACQLWLHLPPDCADGNLASAEGLVMRERSALLSPLKRRCPLVLFATALFRTSGWKLPALFPLPASEPYGGFQGNVRIYECFLPFSLGKWVRKGKMNS